MHCRRTRRCRSREKSRASSRSVVASRLAAATRASVDYGAVPRAGNTGDYERRPEHGSVVRAVALRQTACLPRGSMASTCFAGLAIARLSSCRHAVGYS